MLRGSGVLFLWHKQMKKSRSICILSAFHPTSTLAISDRDSDRGVVNPDLTVKGIKKFCVVDASISPFVVAAHPQVPIYAIAELASEIIAKKYTVGRALL